MAAIKGKEFLIKTVDDGIYSKKIPLREAAEAFLEGAFYQMSDHKEALDKMMLDANANIDPACRDDAELESHTLDVVVDEIRRNEIYMSQKTGTVPNQNRV